MAKLETNKNEKIKRNTASKVVSAKKTEAKKGSSKKVARKATSNKTTSKKETTSKKSPASKSATKRTTSKNATPKTSWVNKTTSKKSSASKNKKKITPNIIEYYDLPNTYNQTTVKLLFQTPKKLFVYWEISETDKQKYFNENGNDFFEKTTPYLVVENKTKNYSFEFEINDFANSWYFDVPDSNCEYNVSLIRKNKITKAPTWITTSNELEVPNNHILFEQNRKEIFFKNVKTNAVTSKSVVNLQFINHLGNIYSANSFYKKFYSKEDLVTLNNPSSK